MADGKTRQATATGKSVDDGAEPSFEAALSRLEEIVEHLESGETSLENALALFEEGVGLSRRCNARLTAVERRLEVLVQHADGKTRTEDLAEDEFRPDGEPSGDSGS
ncbi:MAG: exodeoxyribonuclease VII small subunit [Acidobacteriota bacterium]